MRKPLNIHFPALDPGLALLSLWASCPSLITRAYRILLLGVGVLALLVAACSSEPATGAVLPDLTSTPIVATTQPAAPTSLPTITPSQTPTWVPEPPATTVTTIQHTVQTGDTLLGIALEYDVPMAAIQITNGLGDSTVIFRDQVLTIPRERTWEGEGPFWVVHTVQAGETLSGLARRYDVPLSNVLQVNGLAADQLILVGQELVLPLDGPVAVAQAPTPTLVVVTDVPTLIPSSASPTNAVALEATPFAASDLNPTPTPTPMPVLGGPPADVAAWPAEVITLINQLRAVHGLEPLIYSPELAAAAQAQADDCARRGWCSHTGSDGADVKARILRAGYKPRSWAECWAQVLTPQMAVERWYNESPPHDAHRRTLLTQWHDEIGVGIAEAAWGYYFVADFGHR